jgi:hypothetical protein
MRCLMQLQASHNLSHSVAHIVPADSRYGVRVLQTNIEVARLLVVSGTSC